MIMIRNNTAITTVKQLWKTTSCPMKVFKCFHNQTIHQLYDETTNNHFVEIQFQIRFHIYSINGPVILNQWINGPVSEFFAIVTQST